MCGRGARAHDGVQAEVCVPVSMGCACLSTSGVHGSADTNFSGAFFEKATPLGSLCPDLYLVISAASNVPGPRPVPSALVLPASVEMESSWA